MSANGEAPTGCDAMMADGWDLTTQGYVKGPWRIYHAETWCVAARFDAERMVARGFASEVEAANVLNLAARSLLGMR